MAPPGNSSVIFTPGAGRMAPPSNSSVRITPGLFFGGPGQSFGIQKAPLLPRSPLVESRAPLSTRVAQATTTMDIRIPVGGNRMEDGRRMGSTAYGNNTECSQSLQTTPDSSRRVRIITLQDSPATVARPEPTFAGGGGAKTLPNKIPDEEWRNGKIGLPTWMEMASGNFIPPTTETLIPPTTETLIPPATETLIPPATETLIPPTTENLIPPTTENLIQEVYIEATRRATGQVSKIPTNDMQMAGEGVGRAHAQTCGPPVK